MTGKRMDGIRSMRCGQYRSTFEATVAMNTSVKMQYEPMELSYTSLYKPDFLLPNGILVECKGYFTDDDKAKMRKVKASNPELDIRFLFQPTQSKKDQRANAAWCKKNKFQCSFGDVIPEEWVNEKATCR